MCIIALLSRRSFTPFSTEPACTSRSQRLVITMQNVVVVRHTEWVDVHDSKNNFLEVRGTPAPLDRCCTRPSRNTHLPTECQIWSF